MITSLRIFFVAVLASLLGVCGYASTRQALWDLPREVAMDPWFLATLLDAYCGFLTVWLWIAWRETTNLSRIGWLLALLLLGNMAVAAYVLRLLFRVDSTESLEKVLFSRRKAGSA